MWNARSSQADQPDHAQMSKAQKYTPSSPEDFGALYKYVVIGDSRTGKSCLISRYIGDEHADDYSGRYKSTTGIDYKIQHIITNDRKIKLQILDLGQERFRPIRENDYRGAKGILVCFDVTNEDSFNKIPKLLEGIKIYTPGVVFILVATKLDLVDADMEKPHERRVSQQMAQQFAKEHNMLYCETSSKKGVGIDDTFSVLTNTILAEQALKAQYSSKGHRK